MNCGKLSCRHIIVTDVTLVTRPAKAARHAIYHSRLRADSAGPSDGMVFLLRHAAEPLDIQSAKADRLKALSGIGDAPC